MVYKRVLLKLSGEILKGDNSIFDERVLERLSREIASVHSAGVEIAVVIGGGNIFRQKTHASKKMDRVTADYMGMIATIINGLALQDALERFNLETRLMSAVEVNAVAEPFIRRRALRHIEKGRIVILAAGTGNPYFTTDSAAVLRSSELKCDVLIKGTKVDGVYSSDPKKDPEAKLHKSIDYKEVISEKLGVMDSTAFTLAEENKMPIIIFNVLEEGGLLQAVNGLIGTLVS